jgi:hypothetical protein
MFSWQLALIWLFWAYKMGDQLSIFLFTTFKREDRNYTYCFLSFTLFNGCGSYWLRVVGIHELLWVLQTKKDEVRWRKCSIGVFQPIVYFRTNSSYLKSYLCKSWRRRMPANVRGGGTDAGSHMLNPLFVSDLVCFSTPRDTFNTFKNHWSRLKVMNVEGTITGDQAEKADKRQFRCDDSHGEIWGWRKPRRE